MRALDAEWSGRESGLNALGGKHLLKYTADGVEQAALRRHLAVIERKTVMEFGVQVLARREGEVFQADGVKPVSGGELKDEVLSIELVGDVRKDAGIHEEFGVAGHLGGGEDDAGFEPGGSEQLLAGVLRVAFELDGFGLELLRGGGQRSGEKSRGGEEDKKRAWQGRARVAKLAPAREESSALAFAVGGACQQSSRPHGKDPGVQSQGRAWGRLSGLRRLVDSPCSRR